MYAVVSLDHEMQKVETSKNARQEYRTRVLTIINRQKAQFQALQRQLAAQDEQLHLLGDSISMLGLDAAVSHAAQLVSRVLDDTLEHCKVSQACQIAIQHKDDPAHWGRNFVDFTQKNFTTSESTLEELAQGWDEVRSAGVKAAHPQMLTEYNEQKAVKLISILERSPNHTPLITSILHILKNREAFLSATPCPPPQHRV